MRSKPPTTTKRCSGQVLFEFVIASQFLWSVFLFQIFLCSHYFRLRAEIRKETFQLARAHLYGNDLNRCSPRSKLKQWNGLQVRYHCDFNGSVKSKITLFGHKFADEVIALRR